MQISPKTISIEAVNMQRSADSIDRTHIGLNEYYNKVNEINELLIGELGESVKRNYINTRDLFEGDLNDICKRFMSLQQELLNNKNESIAVDDKANQGAGGKDNE